MFDVITIGGAVRDLFVKSKYFKAKNDGESVTGSDLILPLGAKMSVDEIIFETGGGATNAAVTFSRQGLRAATICRVGDDPGGKAILHSLEEEGINTSLVLKSKADYTGYSIILVAENGERTILTYRGVSAQFKEDMIPKRKLDTKWLFITSLAGNVDLLSKLVNWANKHEIKVALVPGGAELAKGQKVLGPIFAKTDLVIMNKEEAAEVTGIDSEKKEKIVNKICLITRGIGVITDGRFGATVCDKESLYHIGTHGNKAVERTGAGDAFASGFVAGLIKYENIEGALELAGDNASNVVNFFGAKKGILFSGQHPFKEKLAITKTKLKVGVPA